MPYIPGPWLPKKSENVEGGLYETCILALLKPWHSLQNLKNQDQTFCQAYDLFYSQASMQIQTVIENIAFYHNCAGYAHKKFAMEEATGAFTAPVSDGHIDNGEVDFDLGILYTMEISKDNIHNAIDHPFSTCGLLYADVTVDIGIECGTLKIPTINSKQQIFPSSVTMEQGQQMQNWHHDVSS